MVDPDKKKCLFKLRGIVCSSEQVKACKCTNPNLSDEDKGFLEEVKALVKKHRDLEVAMSKL